MKYALAWMTNPRQYSKRPIQTVNKRRGDISKGRSGKTLNQVSAFSRSSSPVITLLTDFGTSDSFVAAMKGVILSGNPTSNIVDITHDVPAHDIEAGAFTLLTVYSSFPMGTIHVAVVDPGVGSARKPILISAGERFFVGPDNGLFSYVCERETVAEIVHLTNPKFFREPISNTFNGRDIFAPVAAALSLGVTPREFGAQISDYVRLQSLKPLRSNRGEIKGRILHVDRFGNCTTNITREDVDAAQMDHVCLRIKGKTITAFRNYFAEHTKARGKVFAIWGSAGFLEIAAENQSSAKLLNAKRGDTVRVVCQL